MEGSFTHSSPKGRYYGRASKNILVHISPEKSTFSGNFTPSVRQFNVSSVEKRTSMRKDILDAVMKRTESVISRADEKVYIDDNPMYEDPRDVIGDKPPKPPRKRNLQTEVTSPSTKEGRSSKEHKRKLTKKYEGLITALIDRCEENVVQISEKDSHIAKLKEKLKTVLEYNKLFAEENDQLKGQYSTLVKYVDECKQVIKEEKENNRELERKNKELEERVKRFEVPDREVPQTVIPLVEVCMSCSSRQIVLNQAREHNTRLQKDMQALKDVLYRLNVQLSRYQEKIRSSVPTLATETKVYKPGEEYGGLDSLLSSLPCKGHDAGNTDEGHSTKSGHEEHTNTSRVVDLSGLLSAQALAPLFDAYQENLQEKDSLILDYEKQFENMNRKSKQIVSENKSLTERVQSLEEELAQVKQSYKKLVVEKETADIEKATLLERAERAESKLKEVYELYEDKMAAMMRDYETVHREYFTVKSQLDASAGTAAQLHVLRARTVPADLHERRLDHCKRLLEELKHQYSMENERKTEQNKKLEEQLKLVEEKYDKLCKDHEAVQVELNTALKNVRLYRKAAVIFRSRVQAAKARMSRVRRSQQPSRQGQEPLRHALQALNTIKGEIKIVKSRAHTSLEELERRIKEQERRAAAAQIEYRRELERASLALEHKEGIIRSLIDKVADVEEVRLSQTNTHRLQGIVSDTDRSPSLKIEEKRQSKNVKLVPGPGGYFQEKDGRRRKS
ncbi:protein Cep89 homolog isoform X2 [Pectinophora gossypiella]|uniref:protein Cep89 homolog isoform X2 n=1 Tax=Pectinophora gossypiella TaxID=13191 RepID=UPI00214F3899|nr:protein Cep89 homolog isoform X2 [Pectinophora gossypiella]